MDIVLICLFADLSISLSLPLAGLSHLAGFFYFLSYMVFGRFPVT